MSFCGGRTPGPAYALASLTGYERHDITKNRAPAYSLGLKLYDKTQSKTPGPYNIGYVDRNGKYPYLGWSLAYKGPSLATSTGPSPLSYSPEKMKYYTPAYSLGLKLPPKMKSTGPSPADYFPQYPPTTGFTIGHVWKNPDKFVPPGPKAAVPIDFYKPRAPAYSLGLKGRPLFNGSGGPGPKYYPGRSCRQCVPHAYSFGLKHAKCAPPLIIYEDNN